MNYDFAELERRLANLVRIGVIEAADYAKAMVRVHCDGFTTEWLPWMTRRAGGDIDWWAPEVGEQVMVIAPSGLMEGAFVMPALYSNAKPEPESSPNRHTVRYQNGDVVTHDRTDGSWTIQCAGPVTVTAGGPVTVNAPSVTIDSPQTTCTGNLTVQKKLTYQGGMAGSGGGTAATIQGNVQVDGNVNASGSIMDGGGNSNHHSH